MAGELRIGPNGQPRQYSSRAAAEFAAARREPGEGQSSAWLQDAAAVVDNGDGTFSVLKKTRANIDLVNSRAVADPPPENTTAEPVDPAAPPETTPQVQNTTPTPVGETRETVLGGYDSEAQAEATATKLIQREQSEARAQGREPANYEVVETADDGFVIQKVTDAPATPAQTGIASARPTAPEADSVVVERLAGAKQFDLSTREGQRDAQQESTRIRASGGKVLTTKDGRVVNVAGLTPQQQVALKDLANAETTANPVGNEDPASVEADESVEAGEFGDVERDLSVQPQPVGDEDPVAVGDIDEFAGIERDLNAGPTVAPDDDPQFGGGRGSVVEAQGERAAALAQQKAEQEEADRIAQGRAAALERLTSQSAAQQNREPEGKGDWRVKLRLASNANYFYNSIEQAGDDVVRSAGILAPLRATDGIIFPYTPSIQILYASEYNQYQPTHSNYKHYFYKGSSVGEVILTAEFTAQDTAEADYLLAVIHFLKSASKMFYGQDAERGSPPPLLFLSGLGDYQFNEAPCVISQFNYVLPNNVDYIRANVEQIRAGTLQTNLRNRNTGGGSIVRSSASLARINSSGLSQGAENTTSRISSQVANLSSDEATYVPTKMEMTITLLPVQNRLQVSQGFSLKEYANGNLIKGGFW